MLNQSMQAMRDSTLGKVGQVVWFLMSSLVKHSHASHPVSYGGVFICKKHIDGLMNQS